MQIGLFASAESFAGRKEKFCGAVLNVKNKKAIWKLENIPYGEYAIKTFHDEDGDGDMDTNFMGLPKERFGFSNNVKGMFGQPGFDKAKFLLNADSMVVVIDLH